jgi:hypothetical protein
MIARTPATYHSREFSCGNPRPLEGNHAPIRFRESAEELYVGRWTREPGWQATVYDLPSNPSEGLWHCVFKEVGSGALVLATTAQDISALRPGDSVTASGRIREVSPLEYLSALFCK